MEAASEEPARARLKAVEHVVANKLWGAHADSACGASTSNASGGATTRPCAAVSIAAYDGREPPKATRYNADTPTALYEAAVVQWYWLKDVKPEADQFNSITTS